MYSFFIPMQLLLYIEIYECICFGLILSYWEISKKGNQRSLKELSPLENSYYFRGVHCLPQMY